MRRRAKLGRPDLLDLPDLRGLPGRPGLPDLTDLPDLPDLPDPPPPSDPLPDDLRDEGFTAEEVRQMSAPAIAPAAIRSAVRRDVCHTITGQSR